MNKFKTVKETTEYYEQQRKCLQPLYTNNERKLMIVNQVLCKRLKALMLIHTLGVITAFTLIPYIF